MAYKLDQDAKTVGKWFASQFASIIKGSTWEESVSIWKLSNVLGWYMSNYLAIKTQLMVGLERKINMLYKYEYYMTAPTKVLLNGEKKVDIAEMRSVTPYSTKQALSWILAAKSQSITAFETDLKSAKSAVTNVGENKTTCGSHVLNATTGSTETIPLGSKTINANTGSITLGALTINLTGATGNSVALGMGGTMTLAGTVINIG